MKISNVLKISWTFEPQGTTLKISELPHKKCFKLAESDGTRSITVLTGRRPAAALAAEVVPHWQASVPSRYYPLRISGVVFPGP